jgi:hypothetical protein
MANTPPNGTIIGAGAPVGSGYPLFVSQDSAGTMVTPHGQYVWNPNAGGSGLWSPAPVDANGNPLTTVTGNARNTTLITNTPLGSNGTYTQAWQDANAIGINYVSASVYSDQSGTLYIDLADDQNNPILSVQSVTVTGGQPTLSQWPQTIKTRYWRLRYVNGGTAQTTFELYQTTMPMLAPRDVALTGNIAQDKAVGPTLLATIPYTSFSANATLYYGITGKLTRNAKRRSIIIQNTMDQDITNANIYLFDSAVSGSVSSDGLASAKTFSHGKTTTVTGGANPSLNSPGDSLQLNLPMGATAPTTGNVTVYLTEVL